MDQSEKTYNNSPKTRTLDHLNEKSSSPEEGWRNQVDISLKDKPSQKHNMYVKSSMVAKTSSMKDISYTRSNQYKC